MDLWKDVRSLFNSNPQFHLQSNQFQEFLTRNIEFNNQLNQIRSNQNFQYPFIAQQQLQLNKISQKIDNGQLLGEKTIQNLKNQYQQIKSNIEQQLQKRNILGKRPFKTLRLVQKKPTYSFKIQKVKRKQFIFCFEVAPFIYENDFDKVNDLEIAPFKKNDNNNKCDSIQKQKKQKRINLFKQSQDESDSECNQSSDSRDPTTLKNQKMNLQREIQKIQTLIPKVDIKNQKQKQLKYDQKQKNQQCQRSKTQEQSNKEKDDQKDTKLNLDSETEVSTYEEKKPKKKIKIYSKSTEKQQFQKSAQNKTIQQKSNDENHSLTVNSSNSSQSKIQLRSKFDHIEAFKNSAKKISLSYIKFKKVQFNRHQQYVLGQKLNNKNFIRQSSDESYVQGGRSKQKQKKNDKKGFQKNS